jgi:hypothetical protein
MLREGSGLDGETRCNAADDPREQPRTTMEGFGRGTHLTAVGPADHSRRSTVGPSGTSCAGPSSTPPPSCVRVPLCRLSTLDVPGETMETRARGGSRAGGTCAGAGPSCAGGDAGAPSTTGGAGSSCPAGVAGAPWAAGGAVPPGGKAGAGADGSWAAPTAAAANSRSTARVPGPGGAMLRGYTRHHICQSADCVRFKAGIVASRAGGAQGSPHGRLLGRAHPRH